jgi:hypothetical protein
MNYTCNSNEFLDEMTKKIDASNRNILKNGVTFNINESCKNKKSEILTDILNKLIENPNEKVIVNNENWSIITSIESDHTKIFNTICQKANSIYELKLDIKKFNVTTNVLHYTIEYSGNISLNNVSYHDDKLEKLKIENENLKKIIEISEKIDKVLPICSLFENISKDDIETVISVVTSIKKNFKNN